MSKKKPRHAMRRTTRNILIAAVFFLLLPALTVLDRRYGGHLRQVIEQSTYADTDFQRYHRKTFTVLEVIDGDTLDIDIPDGEHDDTRIRLIGVDTPETKHPTVGKMYYGPEATDYTTRQAFGKQVTVLLDTVSDQRDRYGRLLAYVVLPDSRVLNAELIKNGYGYAYLSFPHSEFAVYQALMNQAIAEKRGLWKNAVRDDLPKWLRQKRPELLRHK